VIEGAIDGRVFEPWLRNWFVPATPQGSRLVCDTICVHRHPKVRLDVPPLAAQATLGIVARSGRR
jgi:hypothetical protein